MPSSYLGGLYELGHWAARRDRSRHAGSHGKTTHTADRRQDRKQQRQARKKGRSR